MQRGSFDARLQETTGQLRVLQREKNKLQEELTEIQEAGRIDTSGLEQEETELQQAIETIKTQCEEAKREQTLLQQELKHKQGIKAEVDQRVRAIEQQLAEQEAKIDEIVTNRANAIKYLERLRRDCEEKEKDHKQELEKQEKQFQELEKTLEIASNATKLFDPEWDESEPWHLERKETRSYLERKKKDLEAEFKAGKRQADIGNTSPRVIRERLEKAKDELEAQESQYRNLTNLVNQLTADGQDRKKRWMKVLKKSAKKVKDMFDQYVQEKGSSGTVVFDHNDHKLQLQYQVDNTDERTAANDVRNLSGGERSYVTFSLQLALGHVVRLFAI
jgi:chromosome segregation ATPase